MTMMKKTISVLAIAMILVFGISAAFAQNTSVSDNARVKALAELSVKKALALKNVEEAKANVREAKTEYESAKAEWALAKQKYINATAKHVGETNATLVAIERGKVFLNKTTTRMISHLDLIKSKVSGMKALSDSEKANLTADIDTSILALTALKDQIPGVATKQQLVNLSAKIKTEWLNAQKGVSRAVGLTEANRAGEIVQKAENVSSKAQNQINNLKAKGLDTTELERRLAEYNNQTSLALEDVADAKAKFLAGDKESGRVALKNAKDHLKTANEILKNLIKNATKELRQKAQKAKNASSE